MWIDYIKNVDNKQKNIYHDIKNCRLPIVVYGAGEVAKQVTDRLSENGLEVFAYAVDEVFFSIGKSFLEKPVMLYKHGRQENKKYAWVLGIGESPEIVKRFLADKDSNRFCISCTYGQLECITYEEIKNRILKFDETYRWLYDDLSRKTFVNYLNLKISGDISWNFETVRPCQYFNDITNVFQGGTFVDCGAFKGETISEYIRWSGYRYDKVYSFEPDVDNYNALKKMIREYQYNNVVALNKGAWDCATTLSFDAGLDSSSSVSDSGKIDVAVDTIDNVIGNEHVDFIKMDIEGSELPALHGAKNTIERCRPALAISVYHKTDDLITIPQYIKEIASEYKFYLRKHQISSEYELVLYAIPT